MIKKFIFIVILIFVCSLNASYKQLFELKSNIKRIKNQLQKDEITKAQAAKKIKKIQKIIDEQNIVDKELKTKYLNFEKKLNQLNNLVNKKKASYKICSKYNDDLKKQYLNLLLSNNNLKKSYLQFLLKKNTIKVDDLQKKQLQYLCQNIENEKIIIDITNTKQQLQQNKSKQKKRLYSLNYKVKKLTKLQKARQDSLTLYKVRAKKLYKLMQKLALKQKKEIGNFKNCGLPAKGKILKYYGNNKKGKLNYFCNGIQLKLKTPAKIKAVQSGIVAYAANFTGYGRLVIINHQNGWFSLYANNSKINVCKGDTIKKGQHIATYEKTEKNFHFELRKGSNAVNPLPYLKGLLDD